MTTKTRQNARNSASNSLAWLTAKGRDGQRRIDGLTFARLNRIYRSQAATPAVRKAIKAACRRGGFDTSVLAFNAWN